jgi:hypothetical protein
MIVKEGGKTKQPRALLGAAGTPQLVDLVCDVVSGTRSPVNLGKRQRPPDLDILDQKIPFGTVQLTPRKRKMQ